ncbi:resolvase [Hymenobacter sedentarius]|uniref:Resolvase n=1 Tax=Hymenobacter sedentarius TaxID=1411621 RepID=A0A0U3SMF3_9BACT|nr:recombinase family protein [Hymenobacter sedentarius]ALW87348.1 resolvase [Hymenobacter sedentarius]
MKSYVAYYRVSTQKQGQSGLGLEAQQAAVASFVGTHGVIVKEFIEVESGKKDNRTQLVEAIAEAKRSSSVLLIAKLDRLSRNAGFIFQLRDSGVNFQCCDMPDANTLTVGIFAVIAQHERETISKRTKEALAAKKARGFQLGTPANLTPTAIQKGKAIRLQNASTNKANVQAASVIRDKVALGWTLRKVADHLNTHGYRTRTDKAFTSVQVMRLATPKTPAQ